MRLLHLLHVLRAGLGPILASVLFARLAVVTPQVTIALIGLAGTVISSVAAVAIALITSRRVTRIERRQAGIAETAHSGVDELRRIAAVEPGPRGGAGERDDD